MKKKITILLGVIITIALTGCNRTSSINDLINTGDSVVTESNETESESGKESGEEPTNIIDETLIYYPSDDHFYQKEETIKINSGKMELSVEQSILTEDYTEGGDYFATSTRIQEIKSFYVNRAQNELELQYEPYTTMENLRYLFVKVKLKNLTDDQLEFYIGSLSLYDRVKDDEGIGAKYGFSDMKIQHTGASECDYDYANKQESMKDFYKMEFKPGEEIETTIAYVVSAARMNDVYIYYNVTPPLGEYNGKTKRWEPSNSKSLKFLSIGVKDGKAE